MQACSRPSEYVRDEYYDQIEEIKERHAGCREFILSIFPMMPIMEDGINDIDDDEEEDIMDEEDDGEDVDDPILWKIERKRERKRERERKQKQAISVSHKYKYIYIYWNQN